MRQAIAERLEAGFQGLQDLFPFSRPAMLPTIATGHGLPTMHSGQHAADPVSWGMASAHLRPTGSMPAPVYSHPPSR